MKKTILSKCPKCGAQNRLPDPPPTGKCTCGSCGCILFSFPPPGNKLDTKDVAASRRLFEANMEALLLLGAFLKALYGDLRLGNGLFRRREMSEEIESRTFRETYAYVPALLISMLEHWPTRPHQSDLISIISMLEASLFDVQRVDYRPQYEEYRHRYNDRRQSDPGLFGREFVLHSELNSRMGAIWFDPVQVVMVPAYATKSKTFTEATYEATKKIEAGLRKVLGELWPEGSEPGSI